MPATVITTAGSTGTISQPGKPLWVGKVKEIRLPNETEGNYADRVIVITETDSYELDISEGVTINAVLFVGTTTALVEALAAVFFKTNTGSGLSSGAGITDITYADLATSIGASGLTPGGFYRITDFATVHYIFDAGGDQYLDTVITGTTEPLIVQALTVNKLSHEAKSEAYPLDVLHYDWNPANWLQDIAYSDVTTDSLNPVIVPGFKGVIYFRHDTLNDNYMGYDFRNAKFRRWHEGTGYYAPLSISTGVTDVNDYQDLKTFVETGNPDGTYEFCVRSNHFESFKDQYDLYNKLPTCMMGNVVFIAGGWHSFFGNTFGACCFGNTFKGTAESNTFGDNCYANTFGSSFRMNTLGNYNYSNTFDHTCSYNTFGNNCYSNTFGNSCYSNTFGSSCYSNTFGSSCYSNTFGSSCYSNTFGSSCYSNTFGSSCYSNTVGTDLYSNTFGDNCGYNTFGNSCSDNTFGSGCQSNMFVNLCRSNTVCNAISAIDFTTATHVYQFYDCTIFKNSDLFYRLSYYDVTDTIQIVNPTA